jgi:hypothetical protein
MIFRVMLFLAALPLLADTRFTVRRMPREAAPPGIGECDIRLQVDDQVEVVLDRDQVFIRTLSGQDARDDGSQCNVPLPGGEVPGFRFEIKEARTNDIHLVEGPSRRNGGKVIVRIHDGPGGFGRYLFRVTWSLEGGFPPPPPPDRGPGGDYRPEFHIVNAFWGVPGRAQDVTRLLQDRMRDGHIRIRASNEDMGFDPAVGVPKTLVVVYELRGRRQEARIAEGNVFELP